MLYKSICIIYGKTIGYNYNSMEKIIEEYILGC